MKTVLLLLLPCFAGAQSIALIDRGFKHPIAVTKTVTHKQLSNKMFPVYSTDLDPVIQVAEHLARYIDTGAVREPNTQILMAGHSQFAVTTLRARSYNTYEIYLSTRSGNLGASLELVKRGDGPKKALQQVQVFLDYLKNNRHHMAWAK